jgi:Holliday junction resolvase-like predicted endonuclease
MRESEQFTRIDSWWDRKGENEIDIITADDLEKVVTFYEVKRQRKELDMKVLKDKVQRFKEVTGEYDKYNLSVAGLCMEDM